jgi:hypothetical protein
VRWGTKCRQLQTQCLKWNMFLHIAVPVGESSPLPSLLARRSTSGAGLPRSNRARTAGVVIITGRMGVASA